jgi:hypothetical protein
MLKQTMVSNDREIKKLFRLSSRRINNKNLKLRYFLYLILDSSIIVNMMPLKTYMVVNFKGCRINRGDPDIHVNKKNKKIKIFYDNPHDSAENNLINVFIS